MSENIIKVMDKIISELFLFLFQRSGKFIVHGAHFHACVLACQDTVGNIFKYEAAGGIYLKIFRHFQIYVRRRLSG